MRSAADHPGAVAPGARSRPGRPVRVFLGAAEVLFWGLAVLFFVVAVVVTALAFRGTILETGRTMDGTLPLVGGMGSVDVVFEGVPVAVSWPYIVVLVLGVIAWLLLMLLLIRVVHGARLGSARRRVPTRLLYAFAFVWSASSFVFPFVLGRVRPAMADAAGVAIPGVTFTYTMTMVDLLSVLAGPLAVVVVAVTTSGRRHRSPSGSQVAP